MILIHPTAIIEPSVKLGKNVEIGPYCTLTGNVVLADNVALKSHVVVTGNTVVGNNTIIYPFASIGHAPQDLKYQGEDSTLVIGNNNIIREHVTINPGTSGGGLRTSIGNNCLFMVSSHVAHDCVIGNNVILANNVTLGGHVTIHDNAIIGGMSAVHQFVRIGEHVMIGGMSGIEHDVMPFALVKGERASIVGINMIGLKRRGFEKNEINALRDAYDILFYSNTKHFFELIKEIHNKYVSNPAIQKLVEFLMDKSSRGICKPKTNNDSE